MSAVDLATLPAEVTSALRAAFGDARVEHPELLSGGKSQAMVLAFTVGGAQFVLKRGSADHAAVAIACMRLAGERGVGPRVLHADEASGICVMERVEGVMLRSNLALAPGRIERV
ncbi:MAG TPA: phosphotransferase, partial [Polyangiaceae bacterium]